MAVYTRSAGGWVAERVQPEPGSDHEAELEAFVSDPASGWRREPGAVPAAPAAPFERPADSAVKPAWVAWAVACGADEAEAEKLTKPQLIEQYGALAPEGD